MSSLQRTISRNIARTWTPTPGQKKIAKLRKKLAEKEARINAKEARKAKRNG